LNLSINGHSKFWLDRLKFEAWHSETVLVQAKLDCFVQVALTLAFLNFCPRGYSYKNFFHNIISSACISSETHNLQCVFGRIWDTSRGSLFQVFLVETMETGTKNCCLIEAMRLFQNVSVHEFYCLKVLITLEQVNTTE